MKARLLQPITEDRLWLVAGEEGTRPAVGDIGETDQCFTGPDGRQMVMVYFLSADGAREWGADAYETELEPIETIQQPNPALERTSQGGGVWSRLRRWFAP